METRLTPLEQQILSLMADGGTRTNRDISHDTAYPEPTVRRSTLKLSKLQRIFAVHEDYRTGRIAWRLAA